LRYWKENKAYKSKGIASYNSFLAWGSQYWHLQRVTHNKAFKCTMANRNSALDLKIGPKDKDTGKKKQKNKLTREDKELS
jgi:hypothetical protein